MILVFLLLILISGFFYHQGTGTLYAGQNSHGLYVRTYEGHEYFALLCERTLPNGLGNSVRFTAIGPVVIQCEFFGWIDDFGPLP
jgi:hypothetical protein